MNGFIVGTLSLAVLAGIVLALDWWHWHRSRNRRDAALRRWLDRLP